MLIALVVASMAVTVVATSLPAWMGRTTLHLASSNVESIVHQARYMAVRENRSVKVHFDMARRTFDVSNSKLSYRLPDSIGLKIVGAAMPTENVIVFFGDGSSTGGSILLEGGGRQKALKVLWLTGRVSHE